ncbi:MAG TPA: protein kinase [Caldimonas sp.]|jgi:hypothetical protein|nr:protein kinase [Caldimonas sp.]HEX2542659.1 protein kinase [Caldimonas sp.]
MKTEPVHSPSAVTVTALPGSGSGRERRRADGDRDDALLHGTRLHEFEVLGVLGAGGFGIVYLALDHTLRRTVAVKEYLPVDFARRTDKWTVAPRTASDAPTFAAGLQSFMKEAQLLAGFDHPALVKVHRFWKANGTAYMVMPHYPGRTLKEVQRTTGALPDEQSLRRLLHPLLCALEVLHEAQVYHRDISPDNVMVLPDGKPVLLDFGSARHVLNDRTQALTAMFKPSFAAIEQYGDVPGMKQGAWTDLYALAGVMHFMITGSSPVPAALRAVNDAQARLAAMSAVQGKLSPTFLHALDWALAVRPADRPQTVQAFRDALDGRASPPGLRPDGAALPQAVAAPAARSASASAGRQPRRFLHRAMALVAVAVGLCLVIWGRHQPVTAGALNAAPVSTANPPRSPAVAEPTRPPGDTEVIAASEEAPALPKVAAPRKEARASGSSARATSTSTTPAPAPTRTVAGARDPSPRELCGNRNFVTAATCMDRQCQAPAFRSHPQCESVRRYAESRKQAEMSP